MSKRREFSLSIDKEIRSRAALRCENPKCLAVVKRGEVHHIKEDALELDKSRKLTAEDGQFLCIPCHREATKAFAPIIAKVRRVEANHLGATRPAGKLKSRGFQPPPARDRRLTKAVHHLSALARQYHDQ